MTGLTDRWGLAILGSGDTLADNDYQFTDADRRLIDRLLAYAAERHHHTGATGTDHTPTSPPGLSLLTTGGAIPSAIRYYYAFTVLDDLGNESAPSPYAMVDTPPAILEPGAPATAYLTGSGNLEPGGYSYVLSAYLHATTLETKAANSTTLTIPGSSPNNEVSIVLPALPQGADGLNVYRKSPSGTHYLYITSIPAPTNGQIWIDDGSIEGNCDRSLPSANRTANTNAVEITFPGATPTIPDGWSWRIYRSAVPSDWTRSALTDIVPAGSPVYTPLSFVDIGGGTLTGAPPAVAQRINAPPKINLTDAAEVTGTLPSGRVIVPHIVTFTYSGPLTPTQGSFTWVNDFDQADIIDVRAYLGIDSVPAATDVVVDVNRLESGTWASIYEDGPTRPKVLVGQNIGDPSTPVHAHLDYGDALSVDIDQAGGGATPTDQNLTVNILLYVQDGPT
jgi:hypothetical protein